MKSRNLVIICSFLLTLGIISGCAKTENFTALSSKKISKKIIPGTWNIEQLDLWIIDEDSPKQSLIILLSPTPEILNSLRAEDVNSTSMAVRWMPLTSLCIQPTAGNGSI